MSAALTISRLGAQGDGVADTPGGPVYVPFALPGETVTAAVRQAKDGGRGDLIAVLEPSPQRADPACAHFGTCGGCAAQHMEPALYAQWKRGKLAEALKSRGIGQPVGELVSCLPASRRRAVFTARRAGGGMLLGFNAALSHHLVEIAECPVLVPAIVERLDALRRLAGIACATDAPFRLAVTETLSGLDVAIEGAGRLETGMRRRAVDFVLASGLARLTVEGEIVVEPTKPAIAAGGVEIHPPPGGFLQAVEAIETAMAGRVCAHLRPGRRLADLFAGSGAFALRLARFAQVHAVEADAAALASLDRAFRFATGLKRVTVERRDLFRRPLTWKELDAFDGLVFDPPRAGAEEQARQIARSRVAKVAAVSCNPGTLARDLRILIDGGYRLASVTPLDQFLWSPHVEAVALLEKPRLRR